MRPILVVEDSRVLRKMLCDILKENNFSTIEAADGMEGLDKIESHNPLMVISDIVMPNYNGTDFLQMVTTIHPELKLLVITSLTPPNDLYNQAKSIVGEKNIIKKPFQDKTIIAKIKSILS